MNPFSCPKITTDGGFVLSLIPNSSGLSPKKLIAFSVNTLLLCHPYFEKSPRRIYTQNLWFLSSLFKIHSCFVTIEQSFLNITQTALTHNRSSGCKCLLNTWIILGCRFYIHQNIDNSANNFPQLWQIVYPQQYPMVY